MCECYRKLKIVSYIPPIRQNLLLFRLLLLFFAGVSNILFSFLLFQLFFFAYRKTYLNPIGDRNEVNEKKEREKHGNEQQWTGIRKRNDFWVVNSINVCACVFFVSFFSHIGAYVYVFRLIKSTRVQKNYIHSNILKKIAKLERNRTKKEPRENDAN